MTDDRSQYTPEFNAAAGCDSRLFDALIEAKAIKGNRKGRRPRAQEELIKAIEHARKLSCGEIDRLRNEGRVYRSTQPTHKLSDQEQEERSHFG